MSSSIENVNYLGYDVHSYTILLQQIIIKVQNKLATMICRSELSSSDFRTMMQRFQEWYPNHLALTNIQRNTQINCLVDPDLGSFNFILLIWFYYRCLLLWDDTQQCMKEYFRNTLDDIGSTCIQGITHRLLFDFDIFAKEFDDTNLIQNSIEVTTEPKTEL